MGGVPRMGAYTVAVGFGGLCASGVRLVAFSQLG